MNMINLPAFTRKAVSGLLADKGVSYPYRTVWPYYMSPTIARFRALGELSPAKFSAYVKLIDGMLEIGKRQRLDIKLTLFLPSKRELMAIDIESLLNNDEARREIVKRCYWPDRGHIDLRPLVTISRKYFPDIQL
ncbi:MAG TPA: hypothetical protein VMD02_02125 [Candidatus Omnitrophota bacterium]|nr:hypothetical protein [Candidatus Omnitrophota bacterium]